MTVRVSWGIVVMVTAGLGACDAPKVRSPKQEDAGANIAMCVELETALEHTASCRQQPTAAEIDRAFDECADLAAHVDAVCLPALSRLYQCLAWVPAWCSPGEIDCSQPRREWDACRRGIAPDSGTSESDAGTSESDAGTSESDAGTSESDAGTSESDAGTFGSDGGAASPPDGSVEEVHEAAAR